MKVVFTALSQRTGCIPSCRSNTSLGSDEHYDIFFVAVRDMKSYFIARIVDVEPVFYDRKVS